MKKLILASGSPRRKEILQKLKLDFEVQPSDFEEDMTLDLSPGELAKTLSLGKAKDIAEKNKDAIVVGADTFIYFEGKKLGKPKDKKDAFKTLSSIGGKSHSVFTGFTVIDSSTNKTISKSVETKVFIKLLTTEEINDYVDTGEPLDKAGAYGIQGLGALIVEHIEGDFFNVMGLPLFELGHTLKEFGIEPFDKKTS